MSICWRFEAVKIFRILKLLKLLCMYRIDKFTVSSVDVDFKFVEFENYPHYRKLLYYETLIIENYFITIIYYRNYENYFITKCEKYIAWIYRRLKGSKILLNMYYMQQNARNIKRNLFIQASQKCELVLIALTLPKTFGQTQN